MKNRLPFYLTCMIITCVTAGCFTTKKTIRSESMQPGQASFVHIVKWSDETLETISLWYTGSKKNDKRLADDNPKIDPTRLNIGDRIFIPRELLIKTDPVTEEFIVRSAAKNENIKDTEPKPAAILEKAEKTEPKSVEVKPKKKIPAPEPEPAPAEEDEPTLFGPR